MIAPNEFWLFLHRLAEAYDAEGLTTEERQTNIVEQFVQMPAIAQHHVLSDLIVVSTKIPELYPLVIQVSPVVKRRDGHSERAG